MPYCSRCGVEVDDYVLICPLCDTEIKNDNQIPDIPGNYPDDNIVKKDNYIPFQLKKKIFWSVFSFILAASLFIIFAVNYLLNRTITWGWIPIFSVLLSWGITGVIYYLYKRIYILLISIFIMTLIYLFFLFMTIHHIDIFYFTTLPVLTIVFINMISVVFFWRRTIKKGYNVIGFILAGSGMITVGIDIIITYYKTAKILMTWSIVVVSLLFPLILFLFYIHYVLKWTPDIKKIFHI